MADRLKQTARKSTGGKAPRRLLPTMMPMRYIGAVDDDEDEEEVDLDLDDDDLDNEDNEVQFAVPAAPDSTSTAKNVAEKSGSKRTATNPLATPSEENGNTNGVLNGNAGAKRPKPASVTVVDLSSDEEEILDDEEDEDEDEEGEDEDSSDLQDEAEAE